MLLSDARRGDLVITLGAGDVNRAASRLAEALEQPGVFAANNAATSFWSRRRPGVAAGVSANSEPGFRGDEAAELKRGKARLERARLESEVPDDLLPDAVQPDEPLASKVSFRIGGLGRCFREGSNSIDARARAAVRPRGRC